MSALLRSVRCLSRAVRRGPVPASRLPALRLQSLLTQSRTLANAAAAARQETIAPLLQRLDDEVRRFGRLSRKDLDELMEELRLINTVSSSQSLLIIRCCGSLVPEELPEERTKFVKEIWNILHKRKIPMDISHYNALLRVYIENNHKFNTEMFLKTLESKGLEPNRVTYQRLMWQHCDQGDVEGASQILELMREKKMPLSEGVLDALVLGHIRQDNAEGAQSVLQAMSAAGLNPTSRTYTILIGGPAKSGDLEKVKEIIKECEGKEIYFTDKDYLDMIEEFAVGGHLEHIDYIAGLLQRGAGYNQEAINKILRLLSRGLTEAAYKLLKTLTRPSNVSENRSVYSSAFFIKQLVKSKAHNDTVLSFCKRLEEEGISPKATYLATEAALSCGNVELSLMLLENIRASGDEVRQHYFWPLFVAKEKQRDTKGVLDIVNTMKSYNIPVSNETLKEYVIPNLLSMNNDPKKVVELLRESGLPFAAAVKSTLLYLLGENELQKATDVASVYGTKSYLKLFINTLSYAFIKNPKDIESFVKFTIYACSDDSSRRRDGVEVEDSDNDIQDYIGQLLSTVVSISSKDFKTNTLPIVLQKFLDNGLGITDKWADEIQKKLTEDVAAKVNNILSELVSKDLKMTTFERGSPPPMRRSAEQLEGLIEFLESKGETVGNLKKQYLMALIRNKESEKLEQVLEKYAEEKFVIMDGVYAMIVDMYTQKGNLDKANEYLNTIRSKSPDFKLDALKIIRLADLRIKNDLYDSAMELLKSHSYEVDPREDFLRDSTTWRMLSSLAEKGDAVKVKEVFDTLIDNNYVKASNVMSGPLIKVHVLNGDMDKALDAFEECCHKYQFTPWKNELNRKLIMDENAAGLQRLTDLSTLVHGEVNSLYDLVFGFIECGRLKQARKILETPGMRTRNHRFNSICERYGEEGKVECLENLLEATRELSHIDRSEVFQQLLNNYIQADDMEKAMGLWTLLQEENVPPSDRFLIQLGSYLKAKEIDVPFIIPNQVSTVQEKTQIRSPKTDINDFIKNNNLDEAANALYNSLKTRQDVAVRTIRFVINELVKEGNVYMIDKIGSVMDTQQKKSISFNNKRCNALCEIGQIDEYLASIESSLKSSNDEEITELEANFPKGGILKILETKPEAYDRVKNIVNAFIARGLVNVVDALWAHNLLINNETEARQLWNEYLINKPKVLFMSILRQAKINNNTKVFADLINYLKTNPNTTKNTLAIVYSHQIDLFVHLNETDNAYNVLKEAQNENVAIKDIHAQSLNKLKIKMESEGKTFEYTL